ncbi:MAG: TrpR YerC/YecD [Clostridia bacterium]|jgi:TrpR-related protein YerC/YecD|nr:TrpR YerC/YecD [Clostridia bacterium]
MTFEKNENTDYLFKAILSLKDAEECYRFFEDICTQEELKELSRRMQAAKMLYRNNIYSKIASETGLSTATISRVSRSMKYGNGGYLTALDRIEKK